MKDANTNTGTTQVNEVFTDRGEILNSVESDLEGLREELTAERDQFLRLAAEFDNYRRRVKQERAEAAEDGKRELLTELITIADDFDLAVEHLDGTSGQVEDGLRIIRRRFSEMLKANGVDPFESLGETFDPELHEAFAVISSEETESGKVQKEVRRGYLRNGKLLRPALVVVEK